jgi:hypothetical protein
MSVRFQELLGTWQGDCHSLWLTKEVFSELPTVILPTNSFSTFFKKVAYREHDPVDFSQRLISAINRQKIASSSDKEEVAAALRITDIVIQLLHEQSEHANKWDPKLFAMCSLKSQLCRDAHTMAIQLATLQARTSSRNPLAILFQYGDGAKIAAIDALSRHCVEGTEDRELMASISEYASTHVSTIESLKMLLNLSVPNLPHFIDLSKVNRALKNQLFQTCVAANDDIYASSLVEAGFVRPEDAGKLVLRESSFQMFRTLDAIIQKKPDVFRDCSSQQGKKIVREIYKNHLEMLKKLAPYIDIRPESDVEKKAFVKHAKLFEAFFMPKPEGFECKEFSKKLQSEIGANAFQKNHPVEVAFFFPKLLPVVIAELGYADCLFACRELEKRYPPKDVLQFILSVSMLTDLHRHEGCPPSLIPAREPTASYKELNDLVDALPDRTNAYILSGGVNRFVQDVHDEPVKVGVPVSSDGRLKREFYARIKKWLGFIVETLKEKNNVALTEECLKEIASASSHCGGRYHGTTEQLYLKVCCSATGCLSEKIQQQLAFFRRTCLEIACSMLYGQNEHNVHKFNRAFHELGTKLGIPGYLDYEAYADRLGGSTGLAWDVEQEFFRQYTTENIIDCLYDAICHDEDVASAYLDLVKLRLMSEWGYEKYGPLFQKVSRMDSTSKITISQMWRMKSPFSNTDAVSELLQHEEIEVKPQGNPEDNAILAKWMEKRKKEDLQDFLSHYNIIKKNCDTEISSEALARMFWSLKPQEKLRQLEKFSIVDAKRHHPVRACDVAAKLNAPNGPLTLAELSSFFDTYLMKPIEYIAADVVAGTCVDKSAENILRILSQYKCVLKTAQPHLFALEEARIAEFFDQYVRPNGEYNKLMIVLLMHHNDVHVMQLTDSVINAMKK